MADSNNSEITEEQIQALMDAIAQKSDELGLTGTQIIDGVSRSLLCIALTFGANNVGVEIEGVGTVKAKLNSKS